MTKVYIQFIAKSTPIYEDLIELESDVIPRVGEMINAEKYFKSPRGSSPYYVVQSVIYKVTDDGFAPCITARSWWSLPRTINRNRCDRSC
jgi:hypothetical protein